MRIDDVAIRDFRNIAAVDLAFDSGVTVIGGENAQGKTSVLEAVWLLCGGRSFRSNRDAVLIKKGCETARVDAHYTAESRQQTLSLRISSAGREMQRNSTGFIKAAALAGCFCCVVFSPDIMDIIKGAPAQRRRFLDTALCQLYPRYITAARTVSRLINQKNSLLRDCRTISAAFDMLDVFDISLAGAAAELSAMRADYCEKLKKSAAAFYDTISGGRERLDITYNSGLFPAGCAIDAETASQLLQQGREDDVAAAHCCRGPHRDDLAVTISGDDSRSYSSQGQQRSAVLALKLAEAEIFCDVTGEPPLLLLDDVLSELDAARQDFLISAIGSRQAIITGCDESYIARKTGARIYKIFAGALV